MLLTLSRIPPRPGKRLLGYLDEACHALHAPGFLQHPVCDAWDWYLGVYDDDDIEETDDRGKQDEQHP